MKNTRINGQWDIILPDHRADRPEWHTQEGWERARLNSMRGQLSNNDVMYYVGAEEGDMAGLLATWGVTLFMFEPNKLVLPNIKAIWEANRLPDATIFCGFAGNETTPPDFELSSIHTIQGELIADHGFKELVSRGDIPVLKIDDLSSLATKPTAISIDVEGSEWEVLRGAERTLREHHPKIWLSVHPEFMFRLYGEYQADLRRWIKDLGYTETILDYQHELHLYYEAL